jgi:hypothetical protein
MSTEDGRRVLPPGTKYLADETKPAQSTVAMLICPEISAVAHIRPIRTLELSTHLCYTTLMISGASIPD